jgi:hypothetical protein
MSQFLLIKVYKGLSIATAKATKEEQSQAPHHLLDIVTPYEPFTVTHFRDLALPIVSIKIIILFSLWMKKWVSRVH